MGPPGGGAARPGATPGVYTVPGTQVVVHFAAGVRPHGTLPELLQLSQIVCMWSTACGSYAVLGRRSYALQPPSSAVTVVRLSLQASSVSQTSVS